MLNAIRASGEFVVGRLENMNGRTELSMKKANGFTPRKVAEVALLHVKGKLPNAEVNHRFM